MISENNDPEIADLIYHYDRWRRIYGYAGKPPPNEADWESGRLYFRFGYPHPDWWAYILERTPEENYRVLRATTERRTSPVESVKGIFARIQDAGKFMIYEVGESLRIDCRLEPLSWKWDDAGLNPQVEEQIETDRVVKYALRRNPDAYFIMTRGDVPYSNILPLSYDELDAELLEGFPESVTSRLSAESL